MKDNAVLRKEKNGSDPAQCIYRMQQAINQHDLEALADCFEAEYLSEFPAYIGRSFQGVAQMRANWTQIFNSVPDIQADLLRVAVRENTVWSEWEWKGTRLDQVPFLMRGVTIQEVRDGRVRWARLYMEPVQASNSEGAVPGRIFGKA